MTVGAATVRPRAHPRPGRRLPGGRRMARLSVLLQEGLTRLAPRNPKPGELGHSPFTLLTTFRRNGRPIAVPVWAAGDGKRLYVRTERLSGKVKRLGRDCRAQVAPCTRSGRPMGPPMPATGRVLSPEEELSAERALARRYRLVRELFESTVDLLRVDMCYLELELEDDNSGIRG